MKKSVIAIACAVLTAMSVQAQKVVQVGKGSYAEYAPYAKSKTTEHGGCQAYYMEHRPLYITPRMQGKPIPSNDWWTDLIVSRYSGNLWAYPQMVSATSTGVHIEFPTYWEENGNEVKSKSYINVGANSFYPESASADDWHDWGFRFNMQYGEKYMNVTLAHGMPFTWIECNGITPYIQATNPVFIVEEEETKAPFNASHFIMNVNGDSYGIYAPANTRFVMSDGRLEARFTTSQQFLIIATLPSANDITAYEPYAYNVPRNTQVTYEYDAENGKLKTFWNVTAENLIGEASKDVLQGFIPHHYKRSTLSFSFLPQTYLTPRGKMKMAAGHSFEIDYDFNGVLPYYPQPERIESLANPYDRNKMTWLISDYAQKGTFGADTYWGGKGLTQMAHNMCFAAEMGETELFEQCKSRLKDALVNWLTYTPGETQYFFSYYPKWGSYVGFDTSYDSDTFNDHHFHYGYYTYSAALLAMFDEDFKNNYGEMIKRIARDYANWDRNSTDLPFFRTLDPWCGHSFAGGVAGANGNGQESTSEAMQGWGGLMLLGSALGDDNMRDAGIFGYTLESRATAEYWFDRDRENIDYTKYKHPWSTNLTTQGVGWWTWFSGDPLWIHSIQWLPISPILKYLYENLTFAEWDYNTMYASMKTPGWFEPEGLGSASVGNVCLSYLQIFNPDEAASIFDQLWDGNYSVAKSPDTGGITYYITHMHRTYGEIQWNIHANTPHSTAYYHSGKNKYYYMVYNPSKEEKSVTFYEGTTVKVTFKAPAGKLTVYSDAPVLTSITLESPATTVERSSKTQLTATALDQYGATFDSKINWTTSAGSITQDGLLIAPAANTTITITASSNGIKKTIQLNVNDAPVPTNVLFKPDYDKAEVGTNVNASITIYDQFDNIINSKHNWSIEFGGSVISNDSTFIANNVGIYTIKVETAGQTYSKNLTILPPFPNLALNKSCKVSSYENEGTPAKYATDGNYATRWSSNHNDNEWIYVDLSEDCYIDHIRINWEAAYATAYLVQVSNDALNWTTIKTENGKQGNVSTTVNTNGRFVRIEGLSRATIYGISMFELEVYGIKSSTSSTDILGIDITPKVDRLAEGESLQLQATAYNKEASPVSATVSWSIASGSATITADGILTPEKYGYVTVVASSKNITSELEIYVEEAEHIESIAMIPEVAYLSQGDTIRPKAVAYNQFGTEVNKELPFVYTMTGTGSKYENGLFTAGTNGISTIKATLGTLSAESTIKVDNFSNKNLALNKKTSSSSFEDAVTIPSYVNDGDATTRWSTKPNDNEYIVIDLEKYYNINKINVIWQEAYATKYHIEVSMDEEHWNTVYATSECTGGTDQIAFEETPARYVRLVGEKRYNNGWGISIFELEVYGTEEIEAPHAQTIQIVQPYTFYIGTPQQVNVKVYNQYGTEMKQDPTPHYHVNGGGTISEYGMFTPTTEGEWQLNVSFNGDVENYQIITVKEPQKVSSIVVTSESYLTTVGSNVNVAAQLYDQYGNAMEGNVTWSTNIGAIDQSGVFSASAEGDATIEASVGNIKGNCTIKVIGALTNNIVLNKTAVASSGSANLANDGNTQTRWESSFNDNQWIYFDLGDTYQLTSMKILWETASAKDYTIDVSYDAANWTTILELNNMPAATNRVDESVLGGIGRYVRINCISRTTVYGNSIYEFMLYGVKLEAGVPYSVEFVNPELSITDRVPYQYSIVVKDKNGTALENQTILWSATGGAITNTGVYTASEAGNQTITATVGDIMAQITVHVDIVLSSEESGINALNCYKSGDVVYITGAEIATTYLYNIAGVRIASGTATDSGAIINANGLNGVHLVLIIFTDGTKEVIKVIL